MNILFLTAYPPVLNLHGGGIRMYHNIRILASRHAVHVVSFVESPSEREMLAGLGSLCESVTAVDRQPSPPCAWSLEPADLYLFAAPRMREAIREITGRVRIDALQAEYLPMTQFHVKGILSIWTAMEMLSANAWAAFSAESRPLEKLRRMSRWMSLLRAEVGAARRFDRVITMTREDAAYLRAYVPDADIRAIPVGVDLSWYRPTADDPASPVTALFLGNFRHEPNVEAARFLKDHVIAGVPGLRFQVAGAVPGGLMSGVGVELVGHCPDTRGLYRRPNTIVLAPLFSGTGQRVKLLEAFAMGAPVVATSLALRGFPVRNGVEAIVAETAADFRTALVRLRDSVELRRELGARGRRMVEEGFDWNRLERDYLEAVVPRTGA